MVSTASVHWVAEFNEEVARRYFELKGYFVRSNIPYKLVAPSGGAGWSDIDLCALPPITGDAVAAEVKGWHTEAITPSHLHEWPSLFHFTRDEATVAVRAAIGDRVFRRVLIVGRIGARHRDEVVAYAAGKGVEVLEFADVLQALIAGTKSGRSADSGYEHMIRLLAIYGFLSATPG